MEFTDEIILEALRHIRDGDESRQQTDESRRRSAAVSCLLLIRSDATVTAPPMAAPMAVPATATHSEAMVADGTPNA